MNREAREHEEREISRFCSSFALFASSRFNHSDATGFAMKGLLRIVLFGELKRNWIVIGIVSFLRGT